MAAHRWIVAGLTLLGAAAALAVAAAAAAQLAPAPGVAALSGWLAYTAPSGATHHALTLRADGPALELLETATGVVLQSRPLAGTAGVAIQGAPGAVDDALTVDLSGGPLALPQGIRFDGGAGGDDTLLVSGGAPVPGSYQATGPQSGVMTEGGTRIVFSNLEPVTTTAPATSYIITATAGNDTISILNGGTIHDGNCNLFCFLTKVSSPSFESVAFANKLTVTVKGLAGADAFTLNNTLPASGLSKLVLDGGGNVGDVVGITAFTLPSGTLVVTNVITVTQSGIVAAANLAVHAGGQVALGNFSNQIGTVAGGTTGSGKLFGFASSLPTVTVGTVEGLSGLSTNNGPVQFDDVTPGSTLVVSQAIHTAGGPINLFADHMNLNAAVAAGAGVVYLDNETFSEPILLGTKEAGALGLFQADLNQITTGRLQIGNVGSDTGGLTVTADITGTAGWSTLDLRQNAPIIGVFSATLSAPNLALQTNSGDINFQYNNLGHVNTLAGATQGGFFEMIFGGHITIGSVGGVNGIHTAGGNLGVVARKGGLTVQQPLLSGAGALQLNADESASPTDDINVEPGVLISSTTNTITVIAGDAINLKAGSTLATGGAGNVFDLFGVTDTDNRGGGLIAGTIATGGHIPRVAGDFADETLLVDYSAGAALPNDLIYDAGDGLNSLIVNDAGSSVAHVYQGAGTGVSRDFASLIHFSRVQNLTVIGGSAADQFGFRPDASLTLHLQGGPPGGVPGDELFVNFGNASNPTLSISGHDATGAAGQWTFGNRMPVIFSGIDIFDNLNRKIYLPLTRR